MYEPKLGICFACLPACQWWSREGCTILVLWDAEGMYHVHNANSGQIDSLSIVGCMCSRGYDDLRLQKFAMLAALEPDGEG